MNYRIFFCSKFTEVFDTVMRLIIESARESDYTVKTFLSAITSPFSSLCIEMHLIGSAKKDPMDIVIDFDDIYNAEKEMYISPTVLDIPLTGIHYWGVAGSLFHLIPDITTAYITSHLLDNNMNDELLLYKKFTMMSLPFKLQELAAKYRG